MNKVSSIISMLIALQALTATASNVNIRPSYPTHLFYTPTAYLNDEYDLVVSLHEISYTLPEHLQVHMSLVDNIGRNCLGVRYSLADNMQVGAGVAYSLITLGDGGHGIKEGDDSRLGLFLTYGFAHTTTFDAAVTPHMQLGKHISMGADLGFLKTPNDIFSLIGEIGFSFDMNETQPYLNLIFGMRIHPPRIPFLSFDLGIDFTESKFEEFTKNINPYIDIIYTMKTN